MDQQEQSEGNVWENILATVWEERKSTSTLLRAGKLVQYDNGIVVVEFPFECTFQKEKLDHTEDRAIVHRCIEEVLRESVLLKFVYCKDYRQKPLFDTTPYKISGTTRNLLTTERTGNGKSQ